MIKQLVIGSVLLASATSITLAEENTPLLQTNDGSMIVFGCPNCEPEVEVEKVVLEPGSQFLEVRKVGDEMKIYRTENWLGGSPVSYIHMPSNPDDKRFSALEEGPLGTSPLVVSLDITPVASIDTDDLIGPKMPEANHEMVKEITIVDQTPIEPVVASMEIDMQMEPKKSAELNTVGFELRLN